MVNDLGGSGFGVGKDQRAADAVVEVRGRRQSGGGPSPSVLTRPVSRPLD